MIHSSARNADSANNSSSTDAIRQEPNPCGCGSSDHFVQFYYGDEFLIGSVGRFVVQALTSGGGVLLIATPAHLQGIATHLDALGVELDELVESGRYVTLDAAETLALFMRDGTPNAALFERHIGSRVREMTADGRRLSAFGEMVALLWADGRMDAAIQLEELWNALGERHEFSLFCAYPMKGFATTAANRQFLHVCKAHSRVLPAEHAPGRAPADADTNRTIAVLQQKVAALEGELESRAQTERALLAREAELRNFIETSSLGLHWVDGNGTIVWANDADSELLGYSLSEYIGHHISEFHTDKAVVNDILSRLRHGERLRDFEAKLRCKDGSIKTVLIDSSALWDGGPFVHAQCFTRDVTAERHRDQEWRHLAAIVESSDDAIISKTLDGVIRSWNQGAQRILGYTAEETVGQPITMLIPADRQDEEPQILARLRRGERVEHFETVRRRKDGTLVDLSLTISPVKDASGKIIGASKIARDISERKRAEAALAYVRDQLAEANRELERRVHERTASLREAVAQMEEFSYTVSHDLRAPLRGMQVYSEALLEDYGAKLDHEARHCLTRIAENASRLDKMVMDVLAFSRIGRVELRLERVALEKLVRDVTQHYPALQSPRARITVETLHDVQGHEPSLVQIVSNLLSNAVKFVASGVVPTVTVWTERNAAGVRLYVRDNGIGISPAQQSRLFRMFERVHPDLPYEGTGVGLAIVRKAAQRMGGDVGVSSDGTNGTTFWVQLPSPESAT